MVTGGGGYTKNNVARCWAYETAVLTGRDRELSDDIPPNAYYEYYAPHYTLKTRATQQIENMNVRSYVEGIKREVMENLRALEAAPGVAMHVPPPDAAIPDLMANEDEGDPDAEERLGKYAMDRVIRRDDDFYD